MGSLAPAESATKRVLVIRSGALGDTIVAFPALAAFRRNGWDVELVGRRPYVQLADRPELASCVHSVDERRFLAGYTEDVVDDELAAFLAKFDVVVVWARMPCLAEKAGRVGVSVIEVSTSVPEGVHVSDHLLQSVVGLGLTGTARPVVLATRPEASAFVQGHGLPLRGYVAIHPSSGSVAKNWSSECFAEVARLATAAGFPVVWVQGEADELVVPGLVEAVPGCVALSLPLEELAEVLAGAFVYIGNDSGVTHLAAATGAPTVALFRATNPAQWAPRGERVTVLEAGAYPEAVWDFARDATEER